MILEPLVRYIKNINHYAQYYIIRHIAPRINRIKIKNHEDKRRYHIHFVS